MAPKNIKKKRGESSPFLNTAVCRAFLFSCYNKENVRGVKMSEKNPFEFVDGQVILHDSFRELDKVVLNYEQVAAIRLLIQRYSGKDHD